MKEVKIKLDDGIMPTLGSKYAACYDVYCPTDYIIKSGRQIIDLGFKIELPTGWHADIRPRSGFSAKGLECEKRMYFKKGRDCKKADAIRIDADVLLGTIDSDYRGNCGVIMVCRENVAPSKPLPCIYTKEEMIEKVPLTYVEFVIPKGTRIAQMLVAKDEEVCLIEVGDIDMSNDRGGGFGSTGTK